MRKRVTLSEVARHAGCSVTTSSNILQGRYHLYRPETIERVLAAARELGYRANHLARSLARQRTNTIGFILDPSHTRLTRNDYAQHVLDGVLACLEPLEYDVKIISPRAAAPDVFWHRVDNGTLDGALLLAPVIGSFLLEWHQHSQLPVVAVGSTLPERYPLSSVDIDNEGAMRLLVEWVLQQGHREIGFVKGHPLHWSAHQRERAFRAVMSEWGVPIREEWVLQGNYSIESGQQAAEQLLKCSHLPTVVICSDDASAAGLIQGCARHGIRVPEELSVAGFDDELLIQPIVPYLTTVRHDKYQVGYLAAQLLLQQIEQPQSAPQQIRLPGTLVVRQSVMSPRALVQAGFLSPQSIAGGSEPCESEQP
jgi:DNA-binding LacI/PurR family transcriptional regulator